MAPLPGRGVRFSRGVSKCGNLVDGPYCRGCALLQKKFKEDLFTYCVKNRIFQDFQNTSESSDDNTNVVNAPREPFVVKQDPGVNSSQSPPLIDRHSCYECGDSFHGIFYQRCTCKSCGEGAHIDYNCPPKALIIFNSKPCNQTIDELPQTLPSSHPTCYSGDKSPFTCDSTPNYVDDSSNVFNPPPQPPVYSCEFYGNDASYGHYCTPQVPFIYLKPCYNQDFNFPKDFHDFQQQYICCENCERPHETYQYQPMNEDCYHEQNSCYNSNSFGFDQFLPQQLPIPICYDNDEDYTIAITPKEPDNSLSMGDEHLDTISATKSNEFIKFSVENLVPNPSEPEGEHEGDVPACDDFTTFSNILFDADYDFSSSDDELFSDEDMSKKIYSNPLFDEKIISIKIDPHHFNVESDLIESLLNQDFLIISSSLKIDYLPDEFAGELILLKSILPGIDKAVCDPKEEIRLDERLLYGNSSPRPLEEFNSENSNAIIESFSPSPIFVEDSDLFIEEIDLFLASDGSIPSGIDNDYSDSEGDNLFSKKTASR
nr:hypothetical protein [Tanacetum cinerariifolium]